MAHAHDDGHGGHGDPHGGHGHAPPEPPPGPPPPHVLAIARVTRVLGLGLCAGAALWALVVLVQHQCTAFHWSLFACLYGFCIWLAARDTLARGRAAGGSAIGGAA